jgi:nitrate reductase NapE component
MSPSEKKAMYEARVESEDAVIHIISRLRWAVIVFLLATVALVGGMAYAVYNIESVENRVERIEASPCVTSPQGVACQAVLDRAILGRSLRSTCVGFKQAMTPTAYRLLTRCPETVGPMR